MLSKALQPRYRSVSAWRYWVGVAVGVAVGGARELCTPLPINGYLHGGEGVD